MRRHSFLPLAHKCFSKFLIINLNYMHTELAQKTKTCKKCKAKFLAEANYDLDDFGDIIKSSVYYQDECTTCLLSSKIPREVIQSLNSYYDGLLTRKELENKIFNQ